MPKLSQQTLEKRFLCSTCGQTFRTRQGLSGHVQYKHSENTKIKVTAANLFIEAIEFKKNALTAGFNKSDVDQMLQLWQQWKQITIMLKENNVQVSNTDFKSYLIGYLAQRKANEQLHNQLLQELSELIVRMGNSLSKQLISILKKSS